jgi:hypothetical protein
MPITREDSAIGAEKQSDGRCTKNHQRNLNKRQDKTRHQKQDTRHSLSVRLSYITNNKNKINIFINTPHIDTDLCNVIVKTQTNNNVTSCTLNSAYELVQNNSNFIITLLNPDSSCRSNWGCSPCATAIKLHFHHQYCPWPRHPFDDSTRDQHIGHLQNKPTPRPIVPKLTANHKSTTRTHYDSPPRQRWHLVHLSWTLQHQQYSPYEDRWYPCIHHRNPFEMMLQDPTLHPTHKSISRSRLNSPPPLPNDIHWLLLPTTPDELFHDEVQPNAVPYSIAPIVEYALTHKGKNDNHKRVTKSEFVITMKHNKKYQVYIANNAECSRVLAAIKYNSAISQMSNLTSTFTLSNTSTDVSLILQGWGQNSPIDKPNYDFKAESHQDKSYIMSVSSTFQDGTYERYPLSLGMEAHKHSCVYSAEHNKSNITAKQNYHPKATRNQLLGGGPTNTKTCIDVDAICLNTITHAYNTWHALSDSSLDIIHTNHISPLEPWRPCTTLRHHTNTNHSLTRNLKQADVISIKEVCQLPPTQPIIRSTRAKDLCITTEHLKHLLTYNEMTSDSVIMLYVEGFCNRHKLTYMNSNFIPHLREKGWSIVKHYFASNRWAHKRGINRPNITGERAILIPAFIHNNHWAAIVCREIRDRVLFLYSDDLNDPNTEGVLRTLITDRTDPNFCPSNAIWMHCKCTTYHPHSNECGPRAILALSILALHPQPYPEMLLPLMDENLAQITRTWIATSLVSGNFDTDNYKHVLSFSSFNDTRTSNHTASNPADIILWNEMQCQQNHNQTLHESTSIIHPGSPTCTITQPDHNTIQFGESMQTNSYHLSHVNTSSTCTQMDEDNDSTVTPPQTISKKITDYLPTRTYHDNNHTQCTHHLEPFGTPLTIPDPSKNLRIVMQNTQFTFHITNEDHEKLHAIEQLYNLQTSIFVSISPNVNWNNPSHWVSFKQPFKRTFQQIHISATSSDIGKEPYYRNKPNLTGGAAILSFNQWASKVCNTSTDPRGHGSYTVTIYQGKNRKKLSIIGAYISVLKGGKAGDNTLHTQQMTLLERQAMHNNTIWEPTKCPRKEAIKALSSIIKKLQDEDHAIVLAIDANQTPTECYSKSTIRQYSIEWLRREHGLGDPFIEFINQRPPSTTKNPGRDIDYTLTYGVPVASISTLGCDNPAKSDHVGICINIDVQQLFEATYSELGKLPRRKLTLDNVRAKSKYEAFIMQEMQIELLWERTNELYLIAIKGLFDDQHEAMLNEIDDIISRILLQGEDSCAPRIIGRDPWSPKLRCAGRTLSYWQKKTSMLRKLGAPGSETSWY